MFISQILISYLKSECPAGGVLINYFPPLNLIPSNWKLAFWRHLALDHIDALTFTLLVAHWTVRLSVRKSWAARWIRPPSKLNFGGASQDCHERTFHFPGWTRRDTTR